jgi:hypothetical protein
VPLALSTAASLEKPSLEHVQEAGLLVVVQHRPAKRQSPPEGCDDHTALREPAYATAFETSDQRAPPVSPLGLTLKLHS